MAKATLFHTKNSLSPAVRAKSVALLNQQLADTFDLYSQIKQAHWNVKGPQFISLHLLFDKHAEEVLEHVDEIAERAAALGGVPMGTAKMAAASSRLKDFPLGVHQGMQIVRAVVERFADVANSTREAIDTADNLGDTDTSDLFTAISRDLDQKLWFLEAHLQA